MKAKTKFSLITVLNAILCVVFAFIVGATICAGGITRVESNIYSTGAYAANNKYKVLNSTIDNPVVFGETTNNVKIAVDYSLYYDFDVRIDYSLQWSDASLSTNNVILNFAGRDRFIVDDNSIYLTSKVSKGSGTLNIINNVQFADPTDEKYIGKTLTISVDVTLIKAIDYASASELKNNSELYINSIAGNAWAKVRTNTKGTNADVIVYNSRYNAANGISLPDKTAYNGSQKLYGNRYYAGAGMYVMTGSKAVEITVKSLGTWEFVGEYQYIPNTLPVFETNKYYAKSGEDYTLLESEPANWARPTEYVKYYTLSGSTFVQNSIPTFDPDLSEYYTSSGEKLTSQPADWETNYTSYCTRYAPAAFDNNIFYNFNQDIGWGIVSYDSNNSISTIVVGANKNVFIPIFDSIEITSVMNTTSGLIVDYTDYRLVSTFSVNNQTVTDNITKISVQGSNSTETINDLSWTVSNNTLYNPGLYDTSANATHTYYVDLSLTNNTNTTKTYTVYYSTEYTVSNGSQFGDDGPSNDLSSNLWARISDIYGGTYSKTVKVAPYSTVSIENIHEVASGLSGSLGSHDAWINYMVEVDENNTITDENSISIETTIADGSVKYYIRNNSNNSVKVPQTQIGIVAWTYVYSSLQTQPVDWSTNYWNYFYNDSEGNKVPATAKTQWEAGKFYQRSKVQKDLILTILEQVLVPNANSYVGSVSQTQTVSSVTYTMDRFVSDKSITATETAATVGIVNTGTANAYIVNTSNTASYYVRFTGSCLANEDVVNQSGYNYYIGIIRPGQIVEMPMSVAGIVEVSMAGGDGIVNGTIEVSGDYTNSTLSAWTTAESVLSAFNNYFE